MCTLSAADKLIKDRHDEIRSARTVMDIEGFENIENLGTSVADVVEEIQHVLLVEFYFEKMAELLKTELLLDPNTFGTINDVDLLRNNQTFLLLVTKTELNKVGKVPSTFLSPFKELRGFKVNNNGQILENLKK